METGVPCVGAKPTVMENSLPTCGSPISISNSKLCSSRDTRSQCFTPAPVLMAILPECPWLTRYAATQRVPLPEISASLPSALIRRARMSASVAGKSHSTPSAPTPLWRSQMRLLNSCRSAGASAPSMIRKSFPQAEALVKGTFILSLCPAPEWFQDDSRRKSDANGPSVVCVHGAYPQRGTPVFHFLLNG